MKRAKAPSLDVFKPGTDLVAVFAGEISVNQLAMKVGGALLNEIGLLGACEPVSGIGCDQSADEAHEETVAQHILG